MQKNLHQGGFSFSAGIFKQEILEVSLQIAKDTITQFANLTMNVKAPKLGTLLLTASVQWLSY